MMKHAELLVRLACLPKEGGHDDSSARGSNEHLLSKWSQTKKLIVSSCRSVSAYVICHGRLKITIVFSADRVPIRNAHGQGRLMRI